MAFLDLLNSIILVIRRDGYVTAVDDLQPSTKRVDFERYVVPAAQPRATRASADAGRAKTCAGAVRRTNVEGCTKNRNVEGLIFVKAETLQPRKPRKGGNA